MLVMIAMFALLLNAQAPNVVEPDESHDLQAQLHLQVPEYTLNADDFAHALIAVASKFSLPLGIEWVRSPETLRRVNLSWKNTTPQQILAAVVKSQPEYQLEVRDGLVHVFSTTLTSRRKDFLDLTVEHFELRNQIVEVGSRKLRDLVRSRISAEQTSAQRAPGMIYSQAANIGDPEFSFTLQNASVRQVLDKLALESDRKIWVVTYTSDTSVTGAGYLRTATLWNRSNMPDSEQPVWDMFRWTDTIPHF